MMDELWVKILGGGFLAFVSTVLGIKAAQAKTQTRLDAIEKSFTEKTNALEVSVKEHSESLEKIIEKQGVSMGREIGEMKAEIKTIRDDFYKPNI